MLGLVVEMRDVPYVARLMEMDDDGRESELRICDWLLRRRAGRGFLGRYRHRREVCELVVAWMKGRKDEH